MMENTLKTDEAYLIVDTTTAVIFEDTIYKDHKLCTDECTHQNNYSPKYTVVTVQEYLQNL